MELRAGESFADGRYDVLRVLGRGGMSTVYEATETATGRRVALKVLALARSGGTSIERFLQEARIAAMLPHDHVAEVMDAGRGADGMPYLVMELLEGVDLAVELERRGKLPIDEAVDLVLQACEGVAAAHARRLVHRDLKPANLFVLRKGGQPPRVKVLDFGLSKVPRSLREPGHSMTETRARFGTPQYMSPEQVRSTKGVDARSDQHGLALVLFELISGVPAFAGGSPAAVLAAICTNPPARLRSVRPGTHPGLEAAVARALEKRPEKRYPSLAEFADAIAPFGPPNAAAAAARVRALLVHGQGPRGKAGPLDIAPDAIAEVVRNRRRRSIATALLLGAIAFAVVLAILFLADGGAPP